MTDTSHPPAAAAQGQLFPDDVIALLDAALRPIDIKTQTDRRGKVRVDAAGRPLEHVEGWRAMDLANEIFRREWSRETVEMTALHDPTFNDKDQNVVATYAAKVRVTVHGRDGRSIVRDGWGYQRSIGKTFGEAIGNAIKGAETEATKRALATLGPQFGLHLYDKERHDSPRPRLRDGGGRYAEGTPALPPPDDRQAPLGLDPPPLEVGFGDDVPPPRTISQRALSASGQTPRGRFQAQRPPGTAQRGPY